MRNKMIKHKHPCVYCAGRYLYSYIPEEDNCKYAHASRKQCLDLEKQKKLNNKYPKFNNGIWNEQ